MRGGCERDGDLPFENRPVKREAGGVTMAEESGRKKQRRGSKVGDDRRGPPVIRAGWLLGVRARCGARAGPRAWCWLARCWAGAGPRQSALVGRGGAWAAGDAGAGGVLVRAARCWAAANASAGGVRVLGRELLSGQIRFSFFQP